MWSAHEIDNIDHARGPPRALTSEAERDYSNFMHSRDADILPAARSSHRRSSGETYAVALLRAATARGFSRESAYDGPLALADPPLNAPPSRLRFQDLPLADLWDIAPQRGQRDGQFRVNDRSTVTYGGSCAIVGVAALPNVNG